MPENKSISNTELLDFFRSKISGMTRETAVRYGKTISELDLFLTGHRLSLSSISAAMMADWAVEMLSRGLAKSTVAKHLNYLNSLLKAAAAKDLLPACQAPREISTALTQLKDLPPLLSGEVFNSALSRLRSILRLADPSEAPFADLLLYSLLQGALPVETVAMLRKNQVDQASEAAAAIAARNISPRRDYLFPLGQSELTPRQLKSRLSEGLLALGKTFFDVEPFEADPFIRSLWAALALRSGFTASQILGCLGASAPYALPVFCTPSASPSLDRASVASAVATLLSGEMPRWYAMRLRRGVKFDALRREIIEKVSPSPELFYPCETILRRTGRKQIATEQPFISGTAFFKTRPENVAPLFSIIGHEAWCYRTTPSGSSSYAVISSRDMRRFQAAIGIFSPDTELRPLGQLTPRPGESVIVLRAGFDSRPATLENVINPDSDTAIFQVKFTTDGGYEFRVNVDRRQIERITG